MFFFKVPFLKDAKKGEKSTTSSQGTGLTIIGVIDSSGSMSDWWEWLANFWNSSIPKDNLVTITFSTKPALVPTNVLSTKLKDHGG